MTDFQNKSYEKHKEEFNDFSEEALKKHKAWFDEDTVDYWRHYRMIEPISPLIENNPKSSWITVGDGRFGLDSIKLKKIGSSIEVLPTDISPYLLERSKANGHIENYSVENAEALSFADNSFDYALCKEAYHHFPRPYIAIYEMLRVARKAIILIEPNDHAILTPWVAIVRKVKSIIKKILGRPAFHHDTTKFEPSGNYIYSISPRELEKIALGLHLKYIAYGYFNDHYEEGVEFERPSNDSVLFKKVKKKIAKFDRRSNCALRTHSGIIGIIFRQEPTKDEIKGLQNKSFHVVKLPQNPYA